MAHIAADRVKETTTTTGTGALTLAGAASGFRAFSSVMAAADTCFYAIVGGTEWETGIGTFNTTLSRTTVLASSNAGALVNFSAGTKDVFLGPVAAGALGGIISSTVSTNQNDYAPAGLSGAAHIRWDGTANTIWTGLLAGFDGQEIVIHNLDATYILRLDHESASSAAANRFKLPDANFLLIGPGDKARLWYNGAISRWEWIGGTWRTGVHGFVPIASASYINNGMTGAAMGAAGSAANRIEQYPFIPVRDMAINELALEVTTGVASSLAHLAIYNDVAGAPTNIVIGTSSALDCATTGMKAQAVAETWLQRGKVYWLSLFCSSTQSFRTINGGASIPISSVSTSGGAINLIRRGTFTFAAPPATSPSAAISNTGGPYLIRMKLA